MHAFDTGWQTLSLTIAPSGQYIVILFMVRNYNSYLKTESVNQKSATFELPFDPLYMLI